MGVKKVLTGALLAVGAAEVGTTAYYFQYAVCRPRITQHKVDPDDTVSAEYWKLWQKERAWADTLPSEQVSITTYDGLKLNATLIPAAEKSDRTVLAIHGYHSTGFREYATFIRFYHEMGFNILLPDNRAHGRSEGKYIGFGWLDRVDIQQWIQLILAEYGTGSRIALQGVSMGGAAVLMASGEQLPEQVKAIVADCPYTSVKEQLGHVMETEVKFPKEPLMTTTSWLTKAVAGYSFEEASALKQVKKSVTPTIFLTGDADDFVPTEMTHTLYKACPAPKELVVVPHARHAEAHVVDREGYESKVRAFLEQYM